MSRSGTLYVLILLITVFSCGSNDISVHNGSLSDKRTPTEENKDSVPPEKLRDTIYYQLRNKDSIQIKILVPENPKGVLLVLHGWNLPHTEICEKTQLCEKMLSAGYLLIIPDFGKTTYQWENYPQTRKNYLKFPTRKWITDTFFVHLQKEFNLLLPGQRNFVYGVSTGGRGAALLALENPDIFKAAACLSADFDHFALGDEPINTGFYGSRELFQERWKGKDNIHHRAAEFTNGLFLAHGIKDKICPVSQTQNFSQELQRVNSDLKVKTVIDKVGDHTYLWWDTQTVPVIQFFEEF